MPRNSIVSLAFTLAALAAFSSVCNASSSQSIPCDVRNDPYPQSFKSIGVDTSPSSSSSYYSTNYGRVGEAVYFVDTQAPQAPKTLLGAALPIACALVNITAPNGNQLASVTYSPIYGKSLQISGVIASIGIPNRISVPVYGPSSSTPLPTYSYSQIDLYTLPTTTSVYQSVYDYTTSKLGLVTALDSGWLFSTYSNTQVAGYRVSSSTKRLSPIHNLASIGGGGGDTSDVLLNLPNGFSVDSMSIRFPNLAITGTQYLSNYGFCVAAIAVYTYSSTSSSWSTSTTSVPLIPGKVNLVADPLTNTDYNTYIRYRIPCNGAISSPMNALPVDMSFSSTASKYSVAIGIPSTQCVMYGVLVNNAFQVANMSYICENDSVKSTNSIYSGLSTWVNATRNMGTSVSFSPTNNNRLWITSSDTSSAYDVSTTVTSILSYVDRLPNRLMQMTIPGVSRTFLQAIHANGYILILQNAYLQLPNTEVLYIPSVSAGNRYNPISQAVEPCAYGRYKSTSSLLSCTPCPPGTYADGIGSVQCKNCTSKEYCPVASVFNYEMDVLFPEAGAEHEHFESDEYVEAFEALIVIFVFGLTSGTIIVFIVFSSIIILMACIKACTQGRTKEVAGYPLKLMAYFHEGLDADIKKFEEEQEMAATGHLSQSSSSHVHHDPHLKWHQRSYGIAHMFEGYVTCVFWIFGIGAMWFIFTYLSHYDPHDYSKNTAAQNIYRQILTIFVGTEEVEYASSLAQVAVNGFTVSVALKGFSGNSNTTCLPSLITPNTLSFNGCIMPAGRPGTCISNYTVAVDPVDPYSCVFTLTVPQGTRLQSSASLQFTFSSFYTFQAVSYTFTQQPSQIVLPYAQMPHEANQNTAAMDAVKFSEMVGFSPQDIAQANFAGLSLRRSWLMTTQGVRTQRPNQWGPIFDTTWSHRIISFSPTNIIPQSQSAYMYSDISSGFTIGIDFTENQYFTIELTQRLVGKDNVVLAMALGIVAIYHLVHFGETIVEFFFYHGMSLCCKKIFYKDNANGNGKVHALNTHVEMGSHGKYDVNNEHKTNAPPYKAFENNHDTNTNNNNHYNNTH